MPEEDERRALFEKKIEAAREAGDMTDSQALVTRLVFGFATDPVVLAALVGLRKRVAGTINRIAKDLSPALDAAERAVAQLQPFLVMLAKALPVLERAFFPNWRGVTLPDDDELLEGILIDEGIALGWVPAKDTLQLLLDAPSPQARRRIVGSRWRSIVRHCETEVASVQSTTLTESRNFALESAKALLEGHTSSSQALSANLLDTLLRAGYDKHARRFLTGFTRPRLDIDDYVFREAIVLGGIFGAHEPYDGDSGERPPQRYSRHASAHAVSRRQYSRVNAVLALMHVTAFLKLMDQ